MEEDVHAQLCWIASLPDRAMHNFTKIRWSGLLTTPFLRSEFEASGAAFGVNEYPPNVIWGVAWVKVDRRYSPTDILAKYESAQLKAWCTFFGTTDTFDLAQKVVFFRLGHSWLLDTVATIPTYLREQKKGAFVELEGDYHLRLFEKLQGRPEQLRPPRLVLRVPAPWAPLLMSKRWPTVSMPDLTIKNFVLHIPWNKMFLSKPAERNILYDEQPELTQQLWDEVSDFLRGIHAGRSAAGAGDVELCDIERCIAAVQSMSDSLDLDTLKTIYLTHGFTQRKKRFKKEYLLKILMMCSALKTSTGLGNIFRDMVSACLPNGLKYMIKDLVDSAARQMPSKTTVSRYRMVLDAAFMAWERKRNAALDASGGATRYLMCDSSMQHGSEFEGIVCLTIPNRDLLPAFDIANKLVSMRPSSVIVANC